MLLVKSIQTAGIFPAWAIMLIMIYLSGVFIAIQIVKRDLKWYRKLWLIASWPWQVIRISYKLFKQHKKINERY